MRFSTTPRTATATATALVATTLLVPTASAETTPAVESGSVSWPIKSSFVEYIQGGIAKGTVTASDGAKTTKSGDTVTNFILPVNPKGTSINAQGAGTIDLDGTLKFLGHEGHGAGGGYGLDVTYSDIKVQLTATEAKIIADYRTAGATMTEQPIKPITGEDAVIATLPLNEPLIPAANSTVEATTKQGKLEKDGFTSMLNFYSPNYKPDSDAATISLKFGEAKANTPDPAENGSSLSTGGIIGIVVALLALIGGGAFLALQNGLRF